MEQKIKKYPRYKAGQLLTNDNLNNSFDYLEEQIRINRTLSPGNGVIGGLDFDISSDGILTINQGRFITNNGYLVNFDKKDYSVDFKQLVKDKLSLDTVNLKGKNKFVLILKAYPTKITEVSGDIQTGNTKNEEETIVFDVDVVRDNMETVVESFMTTIAIMVNYDVYNEINRKIIQNLELVELRKSMLSYFISDRNDIVTFLEMLKTLSSTPSFSFVESCRKEIDFSISRMKNIISKDSTEIPQYFLFFVRDLHVEMCKIQTLIEKYSLKFLCFNSYEIPENSVELGSIYFKDNKFNKQMDWVAYNRVTDATIKEKKLLEERIIYLIFLMKDMISCFSNYRKSGDILKFEPLITDNFDKRMNKTIPSYYINKDSDISFNIHESHIKFRDDFVIDKYILKGDYWMEDVNKVYDTLSSYISEYSLPITLKKEQLYKKKDSSDFNDVMGSLGELNDYDYKIFSNVIHNFEYLLTDIYKDWYSYDNKIFTSVDNVTAQEIIESLNGEDNILEKQLKMYTSSDDYDPPFEGLKKTIMQRIHRYGVLFDLRAYTALKREMKKENFYHNEDEIIRMIVYLSKMVSNFPNDVRLSDTVESGKTFVLLHFNGNIVATATCSNYDSLLKIC